MPRGRILTRSPQIARGPRRKSLWLFVGPTTATLTAAGGTIMASLNAAALALRPFTVVRTLIDISIRTDQLAATENQVGAFGMAVVSDQALAVGVTAVPTPVTDAGSDLWFVHQWMQSSFLFGSSVAFLSPGDRQYTIDSRGKRKVDEGQDIVVVSEMSSTFDGQVQTMAGRLLILLH